MSFSSNKPYLTTRNLYPENQETPIQFLSAQNVPHELFYRRNHFSYPMFTSSNYWLPVNGSVFKPKVFSLHDLQSLPSKTVEAVLECAGNKRSFFEPKVFGEQWERGAISKGKWKGVSLKTLLDFTGVKEDAYEAVFEGYDAGFRTDTDKAYSYTRSLPIDKALHPDTLIAYDYNDQPLTFEHGFPFRLIVPEWYAMASVKWIKQISIIPATLQGPFQSVDYVYYPNKDNDKDARPVTIQNVNSTIQKPLPMEILNTGIHPIKGLAWTGKGVITKVEISLNKGKSWNEAVVDKQTEKYTWYPWKYEWNAAEKGEYTIWSRATDSNGRTQPLTPYWNRKGYGYNAVDQVRVKIE